ncbi:unnamed protein product [Diamesa serratosioi]
MVNSFILNDMITIWVTVKCSEEYYYIQSSDKYLLPSERNKKNLTINRFINIGVDRIANEREAIFFDELKECLVKIAFMNPKIAICLYEADESDNKSIVFLTKQCNNLPEKIADLKKIKLSNIFLVSFESPDCDVEFCFFDVTNNNPSYVFTAGYLNHTITKSFKLQFNEDNIGFIGVINTNKQTILNWCVPIIIDKVRVSLCPDKSETFPMDILDEPRSYRTNCRSKTRPKEAVVDLTENVIKDRINDPDVLDQFQNEIVCSSIESSCCDLPIVYSKDFKTWQSGWDEQCLKTKTVNQDLVMKWIESSDFTVDPDLPIFHWMESTASSENKNNSSPSTFAPFLKPFGKNDANGFEYIGSVKSDSPSYTPKKSINMIPQNSKLFSHTDIVNLNSKKKDTDWRESRKLAFKTVNEQSINDFKIPRKYSTLLSSSPQQRSPIRPHTSSARLSIERSANKYKDLLIRPSLFENKRKTDNEDDVVFVGETKKKTSSNDENHNGRKRHKLYLPADDDDLIVIDDAERPSTSSSSKNRFKLFKTKNNRLQSIPSRCDLTRPSSSPSQSKYKGHHKR